METDPDLPGLDSSPHPVPDASQARAALDALAEDRAHLVERLVSPWWYHPSLGLLVATLVLSAYLGTGIGSALFVLYCAGLVALITAYRRLTGLWADGWTRRAGRPYAVVLLAICLACLGIGYAARAWAWPGWSVAAAMTVAAVAFVVVGPRYERVLRAEITVVG